MPQLTTTSSFDQWKINPLDNSKQSRRTRWTAAREIEYSLKLGDPLTPLTKAESKKTGARWKVAPPGSMCYSYQNYKTLEDYRTSLRQSAKYIFHHEGVIRRFYADLPNISSDELDSLLQWIMLSAKAYIPAEKWRELGLSRPIRSWLVNALTQPHDTAQLPKNWRERLPPLSHSWISRKASHAVVALSRAIPKELEHRLRTLPQAPTIRASQRL